MSPDNADSAPLSNLEINGMDDQALSQDALYWRQQARAAHRIYGLLYPGSKIHYVFKLLPGHSGRPEQVAVEHRAAHEHESMAPDTRIMAHLDERFLGSMTIGGSPDQPVDHSILIPIPRDPENLPNHFDQTWPAFPRRGMDTVLRFSPVLFEDLKYRYEQRLRRLRMARHEFSSLERIASRAFAEPRPAPGCGEKKPAILIGFHWLETGGAERLGFDSVEWALNAGFRIFVIADKSAPQRLASKLPQIPDVEFIRLDAYLPWPRTFEFLERFIRVENIQVIHIHHNVRLYENLMKLKACFPDLSVIDSTHIIEHADGGFPRISGVWTNYIDYHHVISRQLVSFYLDHFNVSQKVKLGRMLPQTGKDAADQPVFRLTAGQRSCRLVFVGRMVHQKRAPLMVSVVQKLVKWTRQNEIDLQVDMVGSGAYLDVVRKMIEKSRLGNVITLYPSDADIPDILGRADIQLVPSGNEGLALVCYEAIANGALPVSTDVGGQRELLPDALLTRTSPADCIRDMVALVKRLLTDTEFLEDCKTEVATRYIDIRREPTAEAVLGSIYQDILERAPKP